MESFSEDIHTHLTKLDRRVLQKLAGYSSSRSPTVVEIGSYLGASACLLAHSVEQLKGRVCCVDTWTNIGMSEGPRDTYAEFLGNIQPFKETILPIRADSAEAARRFEQKIDLLFIDGDHSFEGCRRDLLSWLPKVRNCGIVALHDFSWVDGVREAIRDYLWPHQQGSGHWEGNIYWTRVRENPEPPTIQIGVLKNSIIVSTNKTNRFDWLQNICATGLDNEVCVVRTGQSSLPAKVSAHPVCSQFELNELAEPIHGLLAGRHRGFRQATGDILIYIDDDVRLPKGWLEAILAPFVDPSVHLVGCRYLPEYEVEPPDWLEQLWEKDSQGCHLPALSLLDYGTKTKEIDPVMIWGLCYAIRRDTLVKLGGFHPDAYPWELRRYRGDGETAPSALAKQLKLKAVYQGKTAVYHQVPKSRMTVEYFERRAYLQGISDSYTTIRREANAPGKPTLRSSLSLLKAALKIRFRGQKTCVEAIRARLHYAYRQGYAYHQSEVRRDPKLLAWVLREDYWDYRLPDGWEKYLGTEQPRSRMTTRELMREEKGYRLQTGIKSQT